MFFFVFTSIVSGQDEILIDTTKKDIFSDKYWSLQSIKNLTEKDYNQLRNTSEKWNSISKSEPAERLNLLMSIYDNTLDINKLDNIIQNLLIYKAIINDYRIKDSVFYLPYRYVTGYPEIAKSYNDETKLFARKIYNDLNEDSEAKLLTEYYTNNFDSLFIKIQDDNYKDSRLHKEYNKYANKVIKDSFSIKFGLYSGIWIPNDELSKIGNHLNTGFQMGLRGLSGWGLNLNMCQRFQDFPDSIELNFNDTSRNTLRYMGGFYGIDISRNLLTTVKSEIDLIAGVALDGFNSTYDIPEEKRYIETTVNSVNFNFGIAYRFIIKQQYFTEIHFRYNIINYDSKTANTDLSGNAITLNINLGILSGGKQRMDILHLLDYKF